MFFVSFFLVGCWSVSAARAADFSGVWHGSHESDYGGFGQVHANITQTGNNLTGTVSVTKTECGDFWNQPLTGVVSREKASFGATVKCPLDGLNYSLTYTQGVLDGIKMSGQYSVSGPDYWDSGSFSLVETVYTISASAGAGGSISPSGSVSLSPEGSQSFEMAAFTGYRILDVKVDGASVGPVTSYVFRNVQVNHTISATFYAIAPVAGFTTDLRMGGRPLVVSFSDSSSGAITSRFWNFGDGSTSTDLNPSHRYLRPGIYTVSLTVYGPGGSDVESKKDYVTVEPGGAIPLMLLLDEDE